MNDVDYINLISGGYQHDTDIIENKEMNFDALINKLLKDTTYEPTDGALEGNIDSDSLIESTDSTDSDNPTEPTDSTDSDNPTEPTDFVQHTSTKPNYSDYLDNLEEIMGKYEI